MKLLIESLRSKWMQLQLRERQLLIFGGGSIVSNLDLSILSTADPKICRTKAAG